MAIAALTTDEVARRCGVTLRMIQWWVDRGIVACDRNGHGREFTEAQALAVAIVAELRRRGVSLKKVRRLMPARIAGEFLVTDGERALWCERSAVIPCVAAAPRPCWVISIGDLRKRLQ
jgi:MerR HTH family regulatory protein